LYKKKVKSPAVENLQTSHKAIVDSRLHPRYVLDTDLASFARVNSVMKAAGSVTADPAQNRVTVEL